MKLKINYFVIPAIAAVTASLGSWLTNLGKAWYDSIKVPDFTPPGYVIGIVWTILFILATIAGLIFWNRTKRDENFKVITVVFVVNAVLNVLWSYLFFFKHFIYLAVWESGVLGLSVLAIIILIWNKNKSVAFLLLPYLLWVGFATFLTYRVFLLQ